MINWVADNATVGAVGLSVLWCPSDGTIAGLHLPFAGWGWDGSTQILTYTSYAGNMGTFCKVPITITSPAAASSHLEPGQRHVLLSRLAQLEPPCAA